MAELTARDKLRRVAIALFVLVCLGGIALAAVATREVDDQGDVITERDDPSDVAVSGDESLAPTTSPSDGSRPSEDEIVEQTIPSEGAEILQQQQIGIDLGNAYRVSRLLIQRTPIQEANLTRRDELNQVFYQPAEGREFDVFPPGRVCAVADVVEVLTGDPVRSVEWCFEVT